MWLAVSIGNTRQHWGWFDGTQLRVEHHPPEYRDERISQAERLVVASVVPAALTYWRSLSRVRLLSLADLPLGGTYPTLGIDRALNLVGAAHRHGLPALVVDFGTAITISTVDRHGSFAGGLILPGLRTQFQALHQATAALPIVDLPATLPGGLAFDTEAALQAGVVGVTLRGLAALIAEWHSTHGGISVATGGDAERVEHWWPGLCHRCDPDLTLWGIYHCADECYIK